MKDRKTRSEKERAEIRKLREEKDKLNEMNKILNEKIDKISQGSKPVIVSQNRKKVIFLYLYDTVVSAMILVFVYWIAINGQGNFDMPYNYFITLVILILIKCFFVNKSFYIETVLQVIVYDLLKPFASMFLGLFICMFCLGKEWRGALGFALDVANTGIIILAVALVVMAIVVASYILFGAKKVLLISKKKIS